MQRLDTFLPEVTRDETRVAQLAVQPGEPPRAVAFVEYVPDDDDEFADTAMLVEVHDLRQRRGVARVVVDPVDTDDPASVEVRSVEGAAGGLDAELMRAVVEAFVVDEDYHRQLDEHRRQFRDAARAFEPDDGPPAEVFEEAGRNDPCPCESGRKFKRCCLKRLDEIRSRVERHELSIGDFRRDWEQRAESVEGINQLLEGVWAVVSAGDQAPRLARRLLGDMGIGLDRDEVEQAAQHVEHVRDIPPGWMNDFSTGWTWQKPLVETVAPVLAELLWQEWVSDVARPHRIKTLIGSGYRFDADSQQRWQQWARAWEQLREWLARRGVIGDEELTMFLDESLQLSQGIEGWLVDLVEAARRRVGELEDDGEWLLPVDVLADVATLFAQSAVRSANDAAVFGYAGFIDAGRVADAEEVLRRLEEAPLADESAAVYLADLLVRWGYEVPAGQVEMIRRLVRRSIDEFGDEELEQVAEQLNQL